MPSGLNLCGTPTSPAARSITANITIMRASRRFPCRISLRCANTLPNPLPWARSRNREQGLRRLSRTRKVILTRQFSVWRAVESRVKKHARRNPYIIKIHQPGNKQYPYRHPSQEPIPLAEPPGISRSFSPGRQRPQNSATTKGEKSMPPIQNIAARTCGNRLTLKIMALKNLLLVFRNSRL